MPMHSATKGSSRRWPVVAVAVGLTAGLVLLTVLTGPAATHHQTPTAESVKRGHLEDRAAGAKKTRRNSLGAGHMRRGFLNRIDGPKEPAGPAGGSLAGEYPNPAIANGAVGTDQIAANAAGVALAGVQVEDDHVTVVSSFNRFGGPPTVQTDGAGAAITVPGLDLNPEDFIHQATLVDTQHGSIRVRDAQIAGSIRVLTGDAAGVNDRRPFSYTVYGTP